MKKVIRLLAMVNITIPSTEAISRARKSGRPAWCSEGSPMVSRTAAAAEITTSNEKTTASPSIWRLPLSSGVSASHCQISSPAVVARVSRAMAGAVRFTPSNTATRTSRTSPAVMVMIGERPA